MLQFQVMSLVGDKAAETFPRMASVGISIPDPMDVCRRYILKTQSGLNPVRDESMTFKRGR